MAKMFAPTEFLADTKRYVVVNSTDEWIDMVDQGTCWRIPPTTEVCQRDEFHPRAHESHRDPETKELIPGTLVVEDQIQPLPEGGSEKMVDLDRAIKTALGYDANLGEYNDPEKLGMKGVSVVPFTADRELIEIIRDDGLERYRKWKIKGCLDLVDAHDLRNEARRRANLGPLPPSREYIAATAALDALREEEVAKYRDQFSLRVDGQPATKAETPAEAKQSMIDAILENKELLKMLATAIEANKIAETPGVSEKTASKLAKVEQEMKEIEEEKAQRRKYRAG